MRVRSVFLAVALLGGVAAAPADSHPGHGPPVIEIGDFAYTPASVSVVEGDYVLWDWQGPDTQHSVTADAGQTMSFDSDQGKTASQVSHVKGDGFAVEFDKAGDYAFHCKVHPSMKGVVHVAPLPDSLKPKPLVEPKLSGVRVRRVSLCAIHRCSHTGVRVRFTVNEAVSMRATVRRLKGTRPTGRVVHEVDFSGPPGTTSRRLDLGRLHRGAYRLSLVAVDSSTGDMTAPHTARVVVR